MIKDANGTVIAEEMKFILGNYGEPLSQQEIKTFMSEAKIDQYGGLNYQELVKVLWSKKEVDWH
jgi:Ca2+-binding EF-hand superfamily protein